MNHNRSSLWWCSGFPFLYQFYQSDKISYQGRLIPFLEAKLLDLRLLWFLEIDTILLLHKFIKRSFSSWMSETVNTSCQIMFSQVFVFPLSASLLLVRCSTLLRRGRYASFWNASLFGYYFNQIYFKKKLKWHFCTPLFYIIIIFAAQFTGGGRGSCTIRFNVWECASSEEGHSNA